MRYPDYLVHYNPNHDKKTGRFTFGDGNGDGVSPDSYRTPELDAAYNKYSSVLKEAYKVDAYTNDRKESDKPTLKKITDMSVKALKNIGEYTEEEIKDPDYDFDYDFFEYFYGYRTVAYLATKGYNKEQIEDIIKSNAEFAKANHKFEAAYDKVDPEPRIMNGSQLSERYDKIRSMSPYPAQSDALYSYPDTFLNADKNSDNYKHIDNYIDECVKLAKEMEHSDMDYSEYLMHFNKNHDKKSGRFSFGDGDGDGVRDDHSNQSKKQSTSDGSKKTIMISSPKNPHNPFSGREKTKIEVSDDIYKEFMKADTKWDIIQGSSNLVSGGLFIASGVLTENPIALGIGVAYLVGSAANYVDAGTHFVNKAIDTIYKNKPVEEIDALIKLDPTIFGKKYYDPKNKEITNLNLKQVRERNKEVVYK